MTQKIQKLPESLINQIAAGEVVESPASIIKELIENSLDAGARKIEIETVAGGHQLIRVEDDGSGMGPEDACLCLERHATSKIRSVSDLENLSTMGFRGEALAAISSVAHFELKTSNGQASRILAEGGKIVTVEPCARNQGTTIEVRSLFYNVPARKQFQKSPNASQRAISRLVETIALAHPEVAFSLNGREFIPTTLKGRIEEILGPHEHEVKGGHLFGFIASPLKAMAMRTGQYLYINKRPIFSPLIARAVKEAFGTRIGEHMYPRFVLFLEIAPDKIDVNVHPQKREVRFRDEKEVFLLVQKSIEEVFTPKVSFDQPISFSEPQTVLFSENFSSLDYTLKTPELDWIIPERALHVQGRFLLLQKEGLILVDLKAAHARILFESFKQQKNVAEPLLWPLEIPISPGEEERASLLQELGIECRILKKTLVVDALPPFLDLSDFSQFYSEWKVGKRLEEISTKFCRSIHKTFSLEQAIRIWKEIQKCKDKLYDPLGNPIFVHVNEEDFARLIIKK